MRTGASCSPPASAVRSRSSAAAARTSAPGPRASSSPAEGIPLHLVETVNLRDEVLNQRGLNRDAALRLARRSLAAGVARARAGAEDAPDPRLRPATRSGGLPVGDSTQPRRDDRPAPLPLPGGAVTAADIVAALCRGCGTCVRNCPQEAIELQPAPLGHPRRPGCAGSVHALRPLSRRLPHRRAGRPVRRSPRRSASLSPPRSPESVRDGAAHRRLLLPVGAALRLPEPLSPRPARRGRRGARADAPASVASARTWCSRPSARAPTVSSVLGCPPELCRHGLDRERFAARLARAARHPRDARHPRGSPAGRRVPAPRGRSNSPSASSSSPPGSPRQREPAR